MSFKLLLVLAVLAFASADRVTVKPCAGGIPVPDFFESDSCTTKKCTFRRGEVFSGRSGLTPTDVFNSLKVEIKATVFGLPIPFEMDPENDDACNFLVDGAECPIGPGQQYVWAVEFPIGTSYPATRGLVIRLSAGEEGRYSVCGIVDAEVV